MSSGGYHVLSRREFLRRSVSATAGLAAGVHTKAVYAGKGKSSCAGKKVIIIGIDGMDPRLAESMMGAGELPNFAGLQAEGGYRVLGTSIPPQSPVAWANFINGAGPGSHGIFDFIHRDPQKQCTPFFAVSETEAGEGYWQVGEHRLQLDFWPFGHKGPRPVLYRKGVPFWDYLDKAGIGSVFYDLPSNYPPSRSRYGHHRCLSGMGTPDMLGTHGTYQHFSEDGPVRTKDEGGGKRTMLFFENETAKAKLVGPVNDFLAEPQPTSIDFLVHRDVSAGAAVIEIQGRRILLKERRWSRWLRLDFEVSMPVFLPDKSISGICRFYLQEVSPNFRLYVTPINIDPSEPALQISEPAGFVRRISKELGLFYTSGFQEDHKALSSGVFSDAEFAEQAGMVLTERLALLRYALDDYEDGLLFFYFSSTDLQSHMFWWDSAEEHPTRSKSDAEKYFNHLKEVYRKMDDVLGEVLGRYGDKATIIAMSDHGFANFRRQFCLNTWLRENGYIEPSDCVSIMRDADWFKTRAYGLGINGLYLNLKGRERDGIVEPGRQREELIEELISKLEAVSDSDGKQVIRKVHRTDKVYRGSATEFAPDLIVGYRRGYRASWSTCLGDMTGEVLSDNNSAWSADHCGDVSEVPGVIFSNRPIKAAGPSLVDVAPTILNEFGLQIPQTMQGRNIFRL